MSDPVTPSIEPIPLVEIDLEERTFAITPEWDEADALRRSVRRVGILTPLLLQRPPSGGALRVVRGFRRAAAARRLELADVPAGVTSDPDTRKLFCEALEENGATRPLTPVEKARALSKLSELGFSESELIEKILPRLGLKADRLQLKRHLLLSRIPEDLQQATGSLLEPQLALRLSRRPREVQRFVLDLILRYRLGRNKQNQLFECFDDLLASQGGPEAVSPRQLWESLGADRIDGDGRLSPSDRWNRIQSCLLKARYPRLWSHKERFAELRASLGLPPSIRLEAPKNFEGESVQVSFSARSRSEMRRRLDDLGRACDLAECRKIFELL